MLRCLTENLHLLTSQPNANLSVQQIFYYNNIIHVHLFYPQLAGGGGVGGGWHAYLINLS